MQFGYFTLNDNHYADNRRSANQLAADILAASLYAEEVGLNSAGSASIISAPWENPKASAGRMTSATLRLSPSMRTYGVGEPESRKHA